MPIDRPSNEDFADDYKEENYDISDLEKKGNDDFTVSSDLIVENVEKLSENKFAIEAYLMTVFLDTDEFRENLKSYIENTYLLYQLAPDSRITIEINNSTINEFGNETVIWINLKTFNIVVTKSDLLLDSYSVFDRIFDNFDIFEFEAYFDSGNEIEHGADLETEEIEVTTISLQVDESTELTTIESITEIFILEPIVISNPNNETPEISDQIQGKYKRCSQEASYASNN